MHNMSILWERMIGNIVIKTLLLWVLDYDKQLLIVWDVFSQFSTEVLPIRFVREVAQCRIRPQSSVPDRAFLAPMRVGARLSTKTGIWGMWLHDMGCWSRFIRYVDWTTQLHQNLLNIPFVLENITKKCFTHVTKTFFMHFTFFLFTRIVLCVYCYASNCSYLNIWHVLHYIISHYIVFCEPYN